MENRRIFWLCLGWWGLTQAIEWGLAIVRVGLWHGNSVAAAVMGLLVVVSGFGFLRPERAGGPTERDLVFWAAVAAAVGGTVVLLV